MTPKLHLQVFWCVVFTLFVTAYAMGCNKDRPKDSGKIVPEDRQLATVGGESTRHLEERNPDEILLADDNESTINTSGSVAFENAMPAWETASPRNLKVSRWLEMRAIKEAAMTTTDAVKSIRSVEFAQDEGMEAVGGGWCNHCGCWLRHGCDSNGNCGISHMNVCSFGSGHGCYLHSGDCISTG